MPNFIITNVCNLSCPFCFASEHMDGEQKGSTARMSLEEFRRQLGFVGAQVVRFCGGEPTLHPEFIDMMTLALADPRREVFIMSNGVWPRPVREHIARLRWRDRRRVGYLFNVLPSAHYRPEQALALHETLGVVARKRATLGVTLYEPGYDPRHVFALADRFRIRRLRYSVASPNVTDPRSWLVDPERDFPALAQIVYRMTMEARQRGIFIHSDCGYLPPCMFSEAQLAEMYPQDDPMRAHAFSCSGPVDIGPGGEAWRCYGLYSTMRAKTADFPDSGALGDYFERRTAETPFTPLFSACSSCELRERYHCAGGCYALRSVKGMEARAEDALVQIGTDSIFARAVPRLRSDAVHVSEHGGKPVVMLCEPDGSWSKLTLSDWETSLLLACDGTRSVDQLEQFVSAAAPRPPKRGVARVLRRLFEQGAIEVANTAADVESAS